MLIFILKESFRSIKKAKASFLISLTSMSISLFLITASFFLFDFSGYVGNELKKNIIVNIFLNDSISAAASALIKSMLEEREDVSSVIYISKSDAAENFIKETGEDFRKILDYNPLPASFRIRINEEFISPGKLRKTTEEISRIDGVDEVLYGNDTAEKIFYLVSDIKKYVLIVTLILFFISVYIISTTSNFITKLRIEEMETMKLIGARISAIKLPVILNSAIAGLAAGCISLIIFILFIYNVEGYISQQFSYKFNYFFLLGVTILMGPVLGMVISSLTLRKITLTV